MNSKTEDAVTGQEFINKWQHTEPLVVERTLAASIEKVWAALTTKEALREWYFEIEAFQPEVGFEFQFIVEKDGHTYSHLCKVTEVIPQKRLAYTWRYAGHPGDSLVTFDLVPEGNNTLIRVTHLGLESFPATPEFARGNFQEGWTQLIGTWLKNFVE